MKVIEKATDRRAEVHIYVEGKVEALREYGEYVDATDKAICCYVPVEEGHKVKIGGKFNGTTMVIAYDAIVDGVFRKSSSYIAKTVHHQKNKKIDAETFLYKTGQDAIDTEMLVAPISEVTATRGEGKETVGTMELRLYVTRQLDVTYTPGRIEKYDGISRNMVDDEEPRPITYKLIVPTLQMAFEKNAAALDKAKVTREHRKMDAKRPGTEPWAVFRFHYRSEEAIGEHKLNLTYGTTIKSQIEPRILDLEPVPPLTIGIKPHKEDGDSSTRASSPTPDLTSAPVKAAPKRDIAKSPTLLKNQLPEPTNTPAPATKMTSTTKAPKTIRETTSNLEVQGDVHEALQAQVSSKPSPATLINESSFMPINKATTNGDKDSINSASTVHGDAEKIANASEDMANGAAKQIGNSAVVNESTEKPIEKVRPVASNAIDLGASQPKPISAIKDSAVKPSSLLPAVAKPAKSTVNKSAASAKAPVKQEPRVVVPPASKAPAMPTPTTNSTPIIQKRPATQPPVTPKNKTTIELVNDSNSHTKRPKITPSPFTPAPTTIVPRIPPGTPSPRPMSVERKVAEQRKKLEAMRQKRLETAKKQEVLDKKMEPYKKRMDEELERLNREMMEEEAAAAEDEEHFKASEEMLKEFEMAE